MSGKIPPDQRLINKGIVKEREILEREPDDVSLRRYLGEITVWWRRENCGRKWRAGCTAREQVLSKEEDQEGAEGG
jgi:hypothetical protein